MSRERNGHALQTTALINEAYVRLVDQRRVQWANRSHFFAISAQIMRRILIDHARRYSYAKRGGGARQVSLDETATVVRGNLSEFLRLDEDRKSTRLNSSHLVISYAVFCLKKKTPTSQHDAN